MIRFRRISQRLLNTWLVDQGLAASGPRYRLRVWRENRTGLAAVRGELVSYVDEAFDDARMRIRRGFEDDLSPFRDPPRDPAENYPALFHRVTLQGYFGETLAVIAVEHWGAHSHTDWRVPAFLFRMHYQEFQHLEAINERLAAGEAYNPDQDAEIRPGRTGDDGLAFRINGENTITDMLVLEAKCLARNNNAKIEEAHRKLAGGRKLPSGVRELINLLDDYDTPDAIAWKEALLKLWSRGHLDTTRYDGVAYACGQIPTRPSARVAWMPKDAPHPAYNVSRGLEAMEFQFDDLNTVINTIYRGA